MANYWEYLNVANRRLALSFSGPGLSAAQLAATVRVLRRELSLRYEKKSLVYVDDDSQVLWDRWDREEVWVWVPQLNEPWYTMTSDDVTRISPRAVSQIRERDAISLAIPAAQRETRLARLERACRIVDDALGDRVRDFGRLLDRLGNAGIVESAAEVRPLELRDGLNLLLADDQTFAGAVHLGVADGVWSATAVDGLVGAIRYDTDENPFIHSSLELAPERPRQRTYGLDSGSDESLHSIQSWLQSEMERIGMRTGMAEYEVALSFAGEDRETAQAIADRLTLRGYRVFYDKYEQAQLWGKDLYQHLASVYTERALFCLILISRHYSEKLWTKHELRNAQARAFTESREYLLPLRLDNTELPGVPGTVGYVSVKDVSLDELIDMIAEKIEALI